MEIVCMQQYFSCAWQFQVQKGFLFRLFVCECKWSACICFYPLGYRQKKFDCNCDIPKILRAWCRFSSSPPSFTVIIIVIEQCQIWWGNMLKWFLLRTVRVGCSNIAKFRYIQINDKFKATENIFGHTINSISVEREKEKKCTILEIAS